MLAAIRNFAKSWVAAVLIGLLIVSFAVFGINDVFRGNVRDAVIQAGDRVVSSADFRREFDAQKRRIEQQAGQPVPLELAVERGFDKQVLQLMASREAFAALLSKIGLKPSDKLVVDEIAKIPAFFDPVSGRFDKTAYERQLAEGGFTTEQFEQMARDDIAGQMALTGIVAGVRAPRAMSALNALYGCGLGDLELAQACRRAEQRFAGVQCGIMDQAAAALSRPGHALFLDCRTQKTRAVRFPEELVVLVAHSGVRHALAESSYNRRVDECAAVLAHLGL